jgi:cellulose synthase/poly-beta-1,6-N-acetylglucosamine synthase-like glycosyltransferase
LAGCAKRRRRSEVFARHVTVATLVSWAVSACFVYLAAVFAAFVVMLVASGLEHAHLTWKRRIENYRVLAESRFTVPVSVIAPAFNERTVIVPAVRSLLAFDYPQFEVIVVNDGSHDDTLAVLQRAFDHERRDVFYRKQFESRRVRGIYRSRSCPNLTVVDKENGGNADALNAGLNLSRYRYVCTVDSDTVYFSDGLLKSMRPAIADPATVVGVTSTITISRRPEEVEPSQTGTLRIDDSALTNFQLLDYLRAFLNNRIGWARGNFMLCSVGAFAIWRRDAIVELGGFSGAFTCEDIEFTFRVHERMRRAGRPFRVVALPDSVGRTEGPDTVRRLISQRARWQRVITETLWHYRRMLFNPRYGSAGLIGVPYYVLVEVLAPVFQVLSVVLVPVAWWAGTLDVRDFTLIGAAIGLANGLLTNIALLLHDRGWRSYRTADLIRLMLLGPADLIAYRPVLMVAQAKGLIDFLRGSKSWNKFERNARAATASS